MAEAPPRKLSARAGLGLAVGSTLLFWVVAELLLAMSGVRPLADDQDPFQGFSGAFRVYEPVPEEGVIRTHARALKHTFGYQEFALDKPDDGYRVFVLGGSSVFGFPWGPGVAFTRHLGVALQASHPDRTVEAINAGAMSYGSHRLRILVDELLEYEPDAIVLYTGHNEFVESRFYADLLDRSESLDAARRWWHRSRLVSAVTRVLKPAGPRESGGRLEPATDPGRALQPGSADTSSLLGLDVERQQTEDVRDAERVEAIARFEDNLGAIVDKARGAGVRVILCTVPSNVGGWQPNQSVFAAELGPLERARVERAVEEARIALGRGDSGRALDEIDRALKIDAGHAGLAYQRGRALLALGQEKAAYAALTRARDLDATPSRAIAPINEVTRALARERDVLLVDLERVFERQAPAGVVGFELIEDYVHPTARGHWLAALNLWQAIEREGWAGVGDADEEVFRASVGAPEDIARQVAGAVSPPSLFYNLGVVLENQGRPLEAMEKYRECVRRDRNFWAARFNLARLLVRAGRYEEAIAAHQETLSDQPDHLPSWISMGEAYRMLGRHDEALAAFSEVTRRDETSAVGWQRTGIALESLRRNEESAAALQRAIELDADDSVSHTELAYVLLYLDRLDEALRHVDVAESLDPGSLRARNARAAVYTELGRFAEAEKLFRQTLQVQADDRFAHAGLELLQRRRATAPAIATSPSPR